MVVKLWRAMTEDLDRCDVEQDFWWARWKDPWALVVMKTGGEWGGGGSRRSHTEMTAHSSREGNSFKVWHQQDDWLPEVVAKSDWVGGGKGQRDRELKHEGSRPDLTFSKLNFVGLKFKVSFSISLCAACVSTNELVLICVCVCVCVHVAWHVPSLISH